MEEVRRRFNARRLNGSVSPGRVQTPVHDRPIFQLPSEKSSPRERGLEATAHPPPSPPSSDFASDRALPRVATNCGHVPPMDD